jgi:hypothetical protein
MNTPPRRCLHRPRSRHITSINARHCVHHIDCMQSAVPSMTRVDGAPELLVDNVPEAVARN